LVPDYWKAFMKNAFYTIAYRKQVWVPLDYKGLKVETELRLDVLVEEILSVELKAQEGFLPIHEAIVLSYMQMLQKPKGIIINFHCVNIFKEGQKTLINSLFSSLPEE
jgi:GxxExxY protein